MTKFEYGAEEEYSNMASVIDASFRWDSTKEGRGYWNEVWDNLLEIEHAEVRYGLVNGCTVQEAFCWSETPQGHKYWQEVNDKLEALKEEYLEQKGKKEEVESSNIKDKTAKDCGLKVGDKFTVGEYYKTRNGEKTLYIGENTLCENKFKYVFCYSDGVCMNVCDAGMENDYQGEHDIIGKWQEPVKAWVCLGDYNQVTTTTYPVVAQEWKAEGLQVKEVVFDE